MTRRVTPIALVLLMFVGLGVQAAGWRWQLDNDRYKGLNAFERAQYDKAARMFTESNFEGAAAEFEKFKIQFPDSDLLPYIVFMIGYSHHNSKHRNAAIKVYNEVLDYFPDVVEDAGASLYWLGIAHLDNGDTRQGMTLLKEMVEDEDYQKHPLAAGALRRLADNEWKNKNYEAAVGYWKQVVRDFKEENAAEANVARDNVTGYYIKNQDYTGYENWLTTDENREDPKYRKWMADNAWTQAFNNFYREWDKYTNFNRDVREADMKAFYTWFKAQKPWYDQQDASWTYYHNLLLFASQRMRDRAETKRILNETVIPLSKEIPEADKRNERFAWLSDRLREAEDFEQALYCISFMSDPPHATFKEYQVLASEGKWKGAVSKLEEIEQMNNADWASRALAQRAYDTLYRLGDYEKAIALYQSVNNPPDSLWKIQDAYKRWGKLPEAVGVLNEIEASFPDQAPNAAWYKASYYDEAGDTKQAISQARRILKVYPQSPASSKAHQLLEKYGIATGGGVVE